MTSPRVPSLDCGEVLGLVHAGRHEALHEGRELRRSCDRDLEWGQSQALC